MDGRPHPDDLVHTWYGHSIGHWEGDTLVSVLPCRRRPVKTSADTFLAGRAGTARSAEPQDADEAVTRLRPSIHGLRALGSGL